MTVLFVMAYLAMGGLAFYACNELDLRIRRNLFKRFERDQIHAVTEYYHMTTIMPNVQKVNEFRLVLIVILGLAVWACWPVATLGYATYYYAVYRWLIKKYS